MADLYSTAVLLGVIRHISRVQTFLLDNFFPLTQTEESEDIHFDVVKRGRTIGVPTANMLLEDYVRPRYGVYAVKARLPDGQWVPGVANLGVRPMFDPPRELLETWLLDWSGDLYGQTLDVALIGWVREERRLDGLDALKAQIAEDEMAARRMLGV